MIAAKSEIMISDIVGDRQKETQLSFKFDRQEFWRSKPNGEEFCSFLFPNFRERVFLQVKIYAASALRPRLSLS